MINVTSYRGHIRNWEALCSELSIEKGYEVVELGTGFRGWTAAGLDVVYPQTAHPIL